MANDSAKQAYTPLFPRGADPTDYEKLTGDHVSVGEFEGQDILKVAPEGLRLLAERAFIDVNHLLRPGHLRQLRAILDDPEASANDRYVALDLLKNANISAGGVLPMCQDTGTAIVLGKKGRRVWTGGPGGGQGGTGIRTRRRWPTASSTPTTRPTCATAKWRRCRCLMRPTPNPTCRPRS